MNFMHFFFSFHILSKKKKRSKKRKPTHSVLCSNCIGKGTCEPVYSGKGKDFLMNLSLRVRSLSHASKLTCTLDSEIRLLGELTPKFFINGVLEALKKSTRQWHLPMNYSEIINDFISFYNDIFFEGYCDTMSSESFKFEFAQYCESRGLSL